MTHIRQAIENDIPILSQIIRHAFKEVADRYGLTAEMRVKCGPLFRACSRSGWAALTAGLARHRGKAAYYVFLGGVGPISKRNVPPSAISSCVNQVRASGSSFNTTRWT